MRKKGYEPLSTEDWARLMKSNVVARLKTAMPVGYGFPQTPPSPPAETFHILTEDSFVLQTEDGDNIDFDE